jgi:hypothetical protein
MFSILYGQKPTYKKDEKARCAIWKWKIVFSQWKPITLQDLKTLTAVIIHIVIAHTNCTRL